MSIYFQFKSLSNRQLFRQEDINTIRKYLTSIGDLNCTDVKLSTLWAEFSTTYNVDWLRPTYSATSEYPFYTHIDAFGSLSAFAEWLSNYSSNSLDDLICSDCMHNEVCHQVAECTCYLPNFTCDECIPISSRKITININNKIKVKLTDFGESVLDKAVCRFKQVSGALNNYTPYETDDNGYTEFQLWQFINIFGDYLYNGAINVIENNEMVVEVN